MSNPRLFILLALSLLGAAAPASADPHSAWKLARTFVEAGARHEPSSDPAVHDQWDRLLRSFDREITFVQGSRDDCRKHTLAFVRPSEAVEAGDSGPILIHLCRRTIDNSDPEVAQTLVHEAAHFVLRASEELATQLEIQATYRAGAFPAWCRYFQKWGFDAHAYFAGPEGQRQNGGYYRYIESIGIQTLEQYQAWQWRYYGMGYWNHSRMLKEFSALSDGKSPAEKLALFDAKDPLGRDILDLARRENEQGTLRFLERMRARLVREAVRSSHSPNQTK